MCVQELNQIFGDSDRPVTFADTLEMKFLERCLLETLRLYPPVPVIARKVQEDIKLGNKNTRLNSVRNKYNKFCALIAPIIKTTVFWDMILCSMIVRDFSKTLATSIFKVVKEQ